MDRIRIDRYLCEAGIGTRTEVKQYIKAGRVIVNSEVVSDNGLKIDRNADIITFDGTAINCSEFEYYMLNKPDGVVSATTDDLHRTVIQLITNSNRKDLFPVGRLDIDTEGLLLITNDGELSHDLLSPRKHVDKTYYVQTDGYIADSCIDKFSIGVNINDEYTTKPAKLVRVSDDSAYITITEGRYHQIKRMFKTQGLNVVYLKRISMGPITLDKDLRPGEYRPLTDEEIKLLKNRT